MTTEATGQIVEATFDELARGNGRPFTDATADDFPGLSRARPPGPKTYRGKQAIKRELLGPLFGQFGAIYTNRAMRILM